MAVFFFGLILLSQSALPEIVVLSPGDGATVPPPVLVKFTASRPCFTALAIDGVRVDVLEHTANDLTVEILLHELSEEEHVLSIDILDPAGEFEAHGPQWRISVSQDAGVAEADETAHWVVEPCEEYDPNMTPEELAKTEMKDGWLISHEPIEFSRVDPGDTCEMLGWQKRAQPRRVFDAFQFFNELDILEIRLHELNETVHKFILVEATRTHSNQPKPLYYNDNKARFAAFHDKIIHVVVDDLPHHPDAWVLENFQRNTMVRGLRQAFAHPNDLVIIADVDEIPAGYVVDLIRSCNGPSSPAWLYARFFNFKFEWEFAGQWRHPQVIRIAQLALEEGGGPGVQPQRVRFGRMRAEHTKIESAGWHCSFFSDAKGVVDKVKAFTHQELNRKDWLDESAIAHAIAEGEDYFNADSKGNRNPEERHGGLIQNPSCYGLPKFVLSNYERFKRWLPDCYGAHGDDVDLVQLASPTCAYDHAAQPR